MLPQWQIGGEKLGRNSSKPPVVSPKTGNSKANLEKFDDLDVEEGSPPSPWTDDDGLTTGHTESVASSHNDVDRDVVLRIELASSKEAKVRAPGHTETATLRFLNGLSYARTRFGMSRLARLSSCARVGPTNDMLGSPGSE